MWPKVTSEKKTSINITSNQDKESHQGSQTLRMSLQNLLYWIAHRWGSARQLAYPTSTFDHGNVDGISGTIFLIPPPTPIFLDPGIWTSIAAVIAVIVAVPSKIEKSIVTLIMWTTTHYT